MGVGQLVNALALLVVARRTSVESFGLFSALFAASLAFGGILDFGSSRAKTRNLSAGEEAHHFRGWLARRTFLQSFPVALTALATTVALSFNLPFLCILGLSAQSLTMNIANGTLALVQARQSPATSAWFVSIGNVVFLLGCVIVPEPWVLPSAGVSAALSWMVTAAFGLVLLRKRGLLLGDGSAPASRPRNPWQGSASFGAVSLSMSARNFDIAIVGMVAGSVDAARLGAVARWVAPMQLVVHAYCTYTFPSLAAAPDDRSAIRLLRSGGGFAALGLIGCVTVFFAGPSLIGLLLGPRYAHSESLLRLLSIATIPVLCAQPLATLLQARHMERLVAKANLLCVAFFLAGVTLFSAFYGAVAVPMLAAVTYAALTLHLGFEVKNLWDRTGSLTSLGH